MTWIAVSTEDGWGDDEDAESTSGSGGVMGSGGMRLDLMVCGFDATIGGDIGESWRVRFLA